MRVPQWPLTEVSYAAMEHLRASATATRADDWARIQTVLTRAGVSVLPHVLFRALGRARVAVNFHPDRLTDGRIVAQALCEDGLFLSQYETGMSWGGLPAWPDVERDGWEQDLF